MSLKIDRVQLEIVIQQDEARQKMLQLDESMRDVRKQLRGLKEGSDEWNAATAKLKQHQADYDKLFEKIGIGALSVNELKRRQTELNAILNKLPSNSPLYAQYKQQVDQINLRLRELKGTAVETKFSLSNLAEGFNKYAAIGASAIASFTGVAMAARESVKDYADIMEAQAQVQKYAGMTADEVADLNEEFKKMDTRTARERLNELAGEAGKLGVQGKQNILDFVDAANVINVSLGDDLGEDAVKNIGKLAQMFGEDKTMGLRGAMLATGSAVNEIGQISSAAEGYLVSFTARVAGSGQQAGLSQAQILGYASVLDQNMQQEEMAATAFQTMLMKMYQEPAKFAKIAGEDAKTFATKMKDDANATLLDFLDILKKKGGLSQLAPLFKEMGLEGVRASGVINVLAANTDNIRIQQEKANVAYNQAISLTKEYNVQNNTVEAGLEKAKKGFKEVSYQLGERLEPYMASMISTAGTMVRVMLALTTFCLRYSTTIGTLITAIGVYLIITKGAIAADKLSVFWKEQVVASAKKLYTTLLANPYFAVAAAIAVVVAAYVDWQSGIEQVSTKVQNLNDIRDEATSKIAVESKELEQLLSIARDETLNKGEREAAIRRLNEISPEYFGNLSLETINTKKADLAVQSYTKHIYLLAEAEAIRAKMKAATEKKIDAVNGMKGDDGVTVEGAWAGFAGIVNQVKKGLGGYSDDWATGVINNYANRYVNKLKSANQEIADLQAQLSKNLKEQFKTEELSVDKPKGDILIKNDKKGTGKPWDIDIKNLETQGKIELLEIKKTAILKSRTDNEFQLQSLVSEKKYQEEKLNIIDKYKGKTKDKKLLADLEQMEIDTKNKILALDEQSEKSRYAVFAEYRDKRLKANEENAAKTKQTLTHEYEQGEISEEIYQVKLQTIESLTADKRLEILTDFGSDIEEMEFANGEDRKKAVEDANNAIIDADIVAATQRAKKRADLANMLDNFRQKFGISNDDDEYNTRLKALDIYYAAELEKVKDNEQAKEQLKKLYGTVKDGITDENADKKSETKINTMGKFGLDTSSLKYAQELKELKKFHKDGLLNTKEYEEAKKNLTTKKLQERLAKDKQYFDAVATIASSFSNAFADLQQAEEIRVATKYDKQIKIAKKSGKDTTKLEEKKEEEMHAVKKKYADLQFAAAVLQISSTTAVAAMQAFSAMAGIPVVGPALGIAAAAATVVAGAAQIAVASANRDAAKGLKSGGYSKDYVEGYTDSGNPDETAGAIPVHKNEFVANHHAVANPQVKQFLDVFNVAQKNGTIRMLNTTQILEQVNTKAGRYQGGYSQNEEQNNNKSSAPATTLRPGESGNLVDVLSYLRMIIQLLDDIAQKELSLPLTDVRKGLKKLDLLEKNAGR